MAQRKSSKSDRNTSGRRAEQPPTATDRKVAAKRPPAGRGNATTRLAQTLAAPGSRPRKPSWSAWQRDFTRRCQEAGLPFAVPPSDLVGWLYLAILDGATNEAKQLIDSGVDVNAPHERGDGSTCLQVAAARGNLELVQYLVQHGADVNHQGEKGTALTRAAHSGNLDVYEYLKPLTDPRQQKIAARRLSVARQSQAEQKRIFRFAEVCLRGLLPTVRRLLKQGIDVNISSHVTDGLTPLAMASRGGQAAVIELLLAAGADPNKESYKGMTPLMGAANPDTCRLLLKAGADVNAADDNGGTVLMWAANAACCRVLLKAGAKTDARDRAGRGLLLSIAWWTKHDLESRPKFLRSVSNDADDQNLAEIFRVLIAAGVDVHERSEDGETAESYLASVDLHEASRVLRKAAADVRVRRRS